MKKIKKLLSFVLALILFITAVPVTELNVSAATLDIQNQVSDPSTIDQWQDFFGVGENGKISTEYAGAVWTDKSVFTKENLGTSFSNVDKSSLGRDLSISVGDDNFLVAMSALSSTKQIKGYSYLPTDTVFVLDTSGSMQDSEIKAMVDATNAAITTLYATNNYNRVGVAVYNLDAVTLMPIDRYTASNDKNNPYVKYSKSGSTRYISVTNGVKDSDGNNFSNSVAGRSGTYTQGGMQEGLDLFLDITDTSIETGNIQGGTKRIPVMVLMTDGDPTSGTSNYVEASNTNRNIGKRDYATTTDELVFLTQLTASNVHNQMEKKYGRDCLFYTLGLGVSGSHAVQMLEPSTVGSATANKLNEYWTKYKDTAQNNEVCKYKDNQHNVSVTRLTDLNDGNKLVENRYYTDKYFPASDANGLIRAFEDIVQEIVLQSKYYPTLVTTGNQDLDGYVTIIDELGENMEVKSIKGMVYGDTLYTGGAMADAMRKGQYGNRNEWTALGWELVASIRERLEVAASGDNTNGSGDGVQLGTVIPVTNDVVIDLLQKAWADGQISYTTDANDKINSFSNYISYYVNAKGQYLGFHGKEHTEDSYPVGTKYIGKSYLFQGEIKNSSEGNLVGSEMMHIVVQVYEEVATGHQTVTWRIPASLVPLVLYELEVNGNVFNSSTIRTLKCTEDTPIRVLYEVGLSDEITPLNVAEIMSNESHKHTSGDGGYWFYSNRWGEGDSIIDLDPNNHKAAVAHFNPSVENERYYYTEDTIIYTESGAKYQGNTKPADLYTDDNTRSGYVHYLTVAKVDANGSYGTKLNAEASTVALQISKDVLELAIKDSDGYWYIPKGTIYQQVARERFYKSENITDTLEYSDYPKIAHPSDNQDVYEVFSFLGNNGRLTLYPATGLKLTKTIDQVVAGTETDNFVFEIKLSKNVSKDTISVTDPDNQPKEYQIFNGTTETETGDTIVLTLAKDETVYVTGLEAGTTYTIKERDHDDYVLKTITENGTGTIEQFVIKNIVAENTEKAKVGDLIVSKTVKHPYGPDYVIPNSKVFTVEVQLASNDSRVDITDVSFDAHGTQKQLNVDSNQYETVTIDKVTTDSSGKITFTLGHEDSVRIIGLPENVTYTVKETNLPKGFALETSVEECNGTILAGGIATVALVNGYTPVAANSAKLDVEITKELSGITWDELQDGASFSFKLEKYDTDNGSWNTVNGAGAVAVTEDNQSVTLSGANSDGSARNLFDKIGTHHFRITEIIPSDESKIEGITYDETHAYFHIIVTDEDMDGALEFDVEAYNNASVEEPSGTNGNKHIVKATFVNRYNLAVANIAIHKNLENNTGVNIEMHNFAFAMFEKINDTYVPVKDDSNEDIVVTPNVNGDVIIPIEYTVDDLDDAVKASENENESENTRTTEYKKEYDYYLKEVLPAGETEIVGMDYDDTYSGTAFYPVEVTVTKTVTESKSDDAQTGVSTYAVTNIELSADVNYKEGDSAATFYNKYELNPAVGETVAVKKTFVGRDMLSTEKFTFNLYKTNSSFDTASGQLVHSIEKGGLKNNVPETVEFKLPGPAAEAVYDKAGTYYYVIEEAKGNNSAIIYDETKWHITVVVEPHDTEAKLVVKSITINEVGGSRTDVEFVNVYKINEPAKIALEAKKVLDGRELELNKFTFGLYNAADVDVDTNAIKDGATAISVAGNAANSGKVVFEEIEYLAPGTYEYAVVEYRPAEATAANGYTAGGYDYDETVKYITVTVTDDGNGNLTAVADKTYENNPATFSNKYEVSPKSISLSGTKVFVDERNERVPIDEELKFVLYPAKLEGSTYVIDTSTNVSPVEARAVDTDRDGKVEFEIGVEYSSKGTYYHILVEKAGDKPTTIYDATTYQIMDVVTDNGDGTLNINRQIYYNGSVVENFNASDSVHEFTNVFVPEPISVNITGEKTLTGRSLISGEFTFELYETGSDYIVASDAEAVATVTNENGSGAAGNVGQFVFEGGNTSDKVKKLYFTDEETRYFVVKEKVGTDPTINYSTIEHNVRVRVTRQGNVLVPEVTEVKTGADKVLITNTYTSKNASADIKIKKNLTNETGVAVDVKSFEFGLYTDETCASPYMINGNHLKVSPTDDFGNAVVTLNYTDASYNSDDDKVYAYYLKEIMPTAPIAGMTYDKSVYKLDVTLSYNAAKELVATPVITKIKAADGTAIAEAVQQSVSTATFDNIYDLGSVKTSISGIKKFEGWNGQEFTIQLYKTDINGNYAEGGVLIDECKISESGTSDQARFAFENIPGLEFEKADTYYFVVREEFGGLTKNEIIYDGRQYVVVVVVEADGTGGLKVASQNVYQFGHQDGNAGNKPIEFVNIGLSGKTTVDIIGKKELTGRTIVDQEFDFELYKTTDTFGLAGIDPLFTTVNREAKDSENQQKYAGYNVEFIGVPLEHEQSGSHAHYFVMKEVNSNYPTIAYDSTEYHITVMTRYDGTNLVVDSATVYKVKNGNSILLSNAYDSSGKIICVENTSSFINEYEAKHVNVSINIDKELINNTGVTNVTEQGYEFALFHDKQLSNPVKIGTDNIPDLAGSSEAKATSGLDGKATISLRFSDKLYDESVTQNHTYTYYLAETEGSKPGMEYDNTIYEVKIVLSYNAAHELTASVSMSEVVNLSTNAQVLVNEAAFTNTYTLGNAELTLEGKKELSGKDAYHSNYTFNLYHAKTNADGSVLKSSTGIWEKGSKIESVVNNDRYVADSTDYDKFAFTTFTYDKAGTYYYIIEEEIGNLGGVTYDQGTYQVTVTVAPSATEAKLVATITSMNKVVNNGTSTAPILASSIVFNNSYVPSGSFTISGVKELENRAWNDSDIFTFELYKANEHFVIQDADANTAGVNPIFTDTVSKTDKTFSLSAAMTGIGTYYYVLKEVVGADPTIAYDESIYQITVDTMDNGDGTMTVGKYDEQLGTVVENEFTIKKVQQTRRLLFFRSTQILDEEVSADEIVFTNTYKTVPVSISVNGTKELTGSVTGREIKDDEFTFELYSAVVSSNTWSKEELIASTTNKGTSFEMKDVVSFEEAGTFYYVVVEKGGSNPIISYDDSEHRIKVEVKELGKNTSNEAILSATISYVNENGNETAVTGDVKLADLMKFSNKYNDTQVDILIKKVVESRGNIAHTKEGFEFQLKDITNDITYRDIVTNVDGNAGIILQYDESDIGKTYKYELSEINNGKKDMVYDEKVYHIEVSVSAIAEKLIAAVSVDGIQMEDGIEVTFKNIYNGKTPPSEKPEDPDDEDKEPVEILIVPPPASTGAKTGDSANLAGLFVLLGAAVVGFFGIKTYKRKKQ